MKVDFNTDADHIDIPNSRIKLFILLLGAIVGIAVGVWFIIDPSKFEYARVYYTPDWKTEIIGCVCVISCSLCVLGIIYMIFKNKPGLVINQSGIMIGRATPKHIITWCDIEKFGMIDISQTRLIQIYIKNPQQYIQAQKSWFKRKLMEFTYKRYGAIFSITTSTLKCDFDQLYDFLNDTLKIYQDDSKALVK